MPVGTWDTNAVLLLLEAIAVCIIGAVSHHYIEPEKDRSSLIGHLVLAVVVGIIEYSFLGEVTNATLLAYMMAGYAAPSIVYNLLAQGQPTQPPTIPSGAAATGTVPSGSTPAGTTIEITTKTEGLGATQTKQ
jgi:hypothetical protein